VPVIGGLRVAVVIREQLITLHRARGVTPRQANLMLSVAYPLLTWPGKRRRPSHRAEHKPLI
jgi:hypothetical protein